MLLFLLRVRAMCLLVAPWARVVRNIATNLMRGNYSFHCAISGGEPVASLAPLWCLGMPSGCVWHALFPGYRSEMGSAPNQHPVHTQCSPVGPALVSCATNHPISWTEYCHLSNRLTQLVKHWITGAFPGETLQRCPTWGSLLPALLFGHVTGRKLKDPFQSHSYSRRLPAHT
jgi:hypothetical protein